MAIFYRLNISNMSHSGVLIYKSVSDFIVTIGQPGDDDFMGRTPFAMSKFVSVRFAHAKTIFTYFLLLSTIFAKRIW